MLRRATVIPTPTMSRAGGSVQVSASGAVTVESAVDASWYRWSNGQIYGFGITEATAPVFNEFTGTVATDGMFFARGGGGRWGFHVFEGYGAEDDKRLTMLAGKVAGVADIYYYKPPAGANPEVYYTVRIGSDVANTGFLFGKDNAVFHGAVEFKSAMTGVLPLGSLAADPTGTNGQVYYDSTNNRIRAFINGAWATLATV